MTESRRIVLNISATYGRNLYAMMLGLFTARWTLMALGEIDYGLNGVVGALTAFISFFNGVLATAIGRFYAYTIGRAKIATSADAGLNECRGWFNTALAIHATVPIILVIIGYPIGEWAIHSFLTIPANRVVACEWVFRFTCISCFVGMINVPFQAMYTAKQYIAELTIYDFAKTTLNFMALYYMVMHPGDWLVKYAAWTCAVAILPQILICIRAFIVFPECRIVPRYWLSRTRFKQLGDFAFWQVFGLLGHLMRVQGLAVVANKFYGPIANASMSVANSVNAHAAALVTSMQGAFTPAITQMYGAGQIELMHKMSFRACKFGALLVLIFIIPLGLELPYVMEIWLKKPPEFAAGLCMCILTMTIIDKITLGQKIAIYATGKIAGYQVFSGGMLILALPLSVLFAVLGFGIYFVGVAMVVTMAFCCLGRVWFARKHAGVSIGRWLKLAVFPVILVGGLSAVVGSFSKSMINPSLGRLFVSTFVSLVILLVGSWRFVLDRDERLIVGEKIRKVFTRVKIS